MSTSTPISNAAFAQPFPVNGATFGAGNGALTLANGMTAGLGAGEAFGITAYANPFLPVQNNAGAAINPYGGDPNWQTQRVGVMRNVPGSLPNPGEVNYLYFIYNPNQITAAFQTNLSSIPPAYLYGSGSALQQNQSAVSQSVTTGSLGLDSSVPNLTSSQSVTWSLFFNRTYDMMYDTNPGENRGVLKDTAALYSLMGTFESSGAVPISTPVQVVFGMTSSRQLWGFTGYISSVNITYGYFRHNMIPSMCEIDLTMVATYVAAQTPVDAGNAANPSQNANGTSIALNNQNNLNTQGAPITVSTTGEKAA